MNETAEPARFDILLERSEAFEEAVAACFPEAGFVLAVSDQKHELVTAGRSCWLRTSYRMNTAGQRPWPIWGARLSRSAATRGARET